jgi:hypothetical protein
MKSSLRVSLSEIKEAIAKLSAEERRELVRSLTRTVVPLTPDQRLRLQEESDAVPDDQWVDWEDLKNEFPVR